MLRRSAEDIEGLVGGDPLPFHQDSLGLTDHLAGGQGRVELGRLSLLLLMGSHRGEGQTGQGRQDEPPAPVDDTEGLWIAGVQVREPQGRRSRPGAGPAGSAPLRARSLGAEGGPAYVAGQVLGVDGCRARQHVEARSLAEIVLEPVDLDDQRRRCTPAWSTSGSRSGRCRRSHTLRWWTPPSPPPGSGCPACCLHEQAHGLGHRGQQVERRIHL